jgi:probable blue pigment (indigoidine) exporter
MKISDVDIRTVLLTLAAPIAWGTSYVTVTELLPPGRPLLVATMRVLPAGILLAAVGLVTARWRPRRRQEWIHTALLAVCNFVCFFPLLIVGIYRLPGGVAASFGGLQPLLVALIGCIVARRRARLVEIVVGAIAVLGVAMVVVRPGAGIDPIGVLAAAGANVSFAAGVVLTKRLPPPPHRLAATGWQLLLSAPLLALLALVIEGLPPAPTVRHAIGFAYLGLVVTGVAFALWFDGIRRLPVQAPPLLGLAGPVVGAMLGWTIRHESLTPIQIGGLAITIAAIAYGAIVGTQRQPLPATAAATIGPPGRTRLRSRRSGHACSPRRRGDAVPLL